MCAQVAQLPHDERWDEAQLTALLAAHLPALGPQQARWLRDALAIAAYHAQTDGPVVETLISDDAPQFQGVAAAQALCWVHEGRHYKKLLPVGAGASGAPGDVPHPVLGLLSRVAGLSAGPDRGGAGATRRGV